MTLDPIIAVDIDIDSSGTPRAGFGVPLIPSHTAAWDERTRSYSGSAEILEDFPATSPEYLCGSAMFNQAEPPEVVKIGRVNDALVTQRYELEAQTVTNSKKYTVVTSGVGFEEEDVEFTSDAGATKAEIHIGLITALNAVVDKNYLAAFSALASSVDFTFTAAASDVCTAVAHGLNTGDGPFQLTTSAADLPLNLLTATDYYAIKIDADTFKLATSLVNAMAGTAVDIADAGTGVHTINLTAGTTLSPILGFTVTGDANAEWFSLSIPNRDAALLSIKQTHAAGTIATALGEVLDEDPDFYCLVTLYNSNAYVKAVAAWVESNKRLYWVDVNESIARTGAYDIESVVSGDTLGELRALTYARTMYQYHSKPSTFFSAAWAGDWLPTDPGEATAALKTLVGVTVDSFKTTHITNLNNRRANYYRLFGNRGMTWEGKVGNTDYAFIDVTRNIDWLKDGIQVAGVDTLAGASIVPFTPDGTSQLSGAVRGFLLGEGISSGVLSNTPEPAVTPPKFSTIPTQDKKERVYRKMKFRATLSGAIHAADIDGTVTF